MNSRKKWPSVENGHLGEKQDQTSELSGNTEGVTMFVKETPQIGNR